MMKTDLQEEVAKEIVKRQIELQSERSLWEGHWEEIAERFAPNYVGTFNQSRRTQGQKNTEKRMDGVGTLAIDRLSSVTKSLMTPDGAKWHRLTAPDIDLNKILRVRQFYTETTDTLFRYRESWMANYSSQQHEVYTSLVTFGTGVMYVDRHPEGGFRYRSIPLGEVFLDENHQRIIDTVYRKFELKARQAVIKFRDHIDKLPKIIVEAAEKRPDQKFEFIHCIKPRSDYMPWRIDGKGKRFVGYYVSVMNPRIIDERGFNQNPYIIGRYMTSPGETYGRSPAMTCLPNIKVLNEQKITTLKVGHRLSDPILLAHDDGVIGSISLRPGTVAWGGVNAQGQRMIQPLDMPGGQLPALEKLTEQEKMFINDAFLVNLFQVLVDSPQMTATEVMERVREKSNLLSPTMGRYQSEALGPMIQRELFLLAEDDRLPDMPPELVEAGGVYKVEYESPLSRSARAEEASGFMRTLESVTAYANVSRDPSAFDWFNMDVAIPAIADIQGVPATWMNTQEQVAERREGRQQQVAVQQMIDAGPSAAAIMKAVGPGAKR